MIIKDYKNIDDPYLKGFFIEYISSVELPLIDYAAIGLQNKILGTSRSIMTNQDWQEQFKKTELFLKDPLRQALFKTKNKYLLFDQIEKVDETSKYIMQSRAKFGIKNGFSIINRNPTHNVVLTLGTGYSKFNCEKFILNHHLILDQILFDLKKLFSHATENLRI